MAYGEFAYPLGSLVRLIWNGPVWTIVWRGWLLVRHPATGVTRRLDVYVLDDRHWDAHYADELEPAFSGRSKPAFTY